MSRRRQSGSVQPSLRCLGRTREPALHRGRRTGNYLRDAAWRTVDEYDCRPTAMSP